MAQFKIRLVEADLLPEFEVYESIVIDQSCRVRDLCNICGDEIIDFDSATNAQFIDAVQQILDYISAVSIFFADFLSDRVSASFQQLVCNSSRFSAWYQRLDDLIRHVPRNIIVIKTGYYFYNLTQNCRILEMMVRRYIRGYLDLHPDTDITQFPYNWSNVPFDPAEPDLDIDFPSSLFVH